MTQIIKHLHDPEWWFTAFVIAIIASVIAGFLKDALARWLSRTSSWYRNRKAASISRREQRVELLAARPELLILTTIHAAIAVFIFFFTFALFLFIPLWAAYATSSPTLSSWILFRPLPGTDPSGVVSSMEPLTFLIGGLSLFAGYAAGLLVSLTTRAYRLLYSRSAQSIKAS